MAEARIPVDLFNPGQVFACLGFLEAADVLLGDAEGGFDWKDEADVCFVLRAAGEINPVEEVLVFLAGASLQRWGPVGYADPPLKKKAKTSDTEDDTEEDSEESESSSAQGSLPTLNLEEAFPSPTSDRMSLPIRLISRNRPLVDIGHWADGSSRESFKLYAGNRSADRIARAMLFGVREKPKKNQTIGSLKTQGIAQLWKTHRDELITRPFDVLTSMGGSFNFDPRDAWTAIDAGYSPNDQSHEIAASPVVEFLAAWGLEHARPDEFQTRKVRYAVWGIELPVVFARASLVGSIPAIPYRRFRFNLNLSGKNKVVTFSQEETQS